MLTHTVDARVALEIQTELLIPSFLPFWHLACATVGEEGYWRPNKTMRSKPQKEDEEETEKVNWLS